MADQCNCIHAGDINAEGQLWCKKKNVYVTGSQEETCEFFQAK